jgi:DNA-binding transcriptional LysR family regulator
MDTLAGMRLFAKVAEAGSFSAAGRALGLAPSSVSRQINALEDGLGARLLNRTTRKLSLTEAGQIYFERAQRILSDIDEATVAVSRLQETPRGHLRINVPVIFGRRYIAPVLPKFLGRFPEIKVELTVTDHYIDLVEAGADLAIRIGGLTHQTFVARKLAIMNRVLCASPEYLARRGEPLRPVDLARHNCLVFKLRPGPTIWELEGADGSHDIAITGNLESNNAEALSAAMVAGLGIALLPIWVVGREIQDGLVKVVLPQYRAHPMDAADEVYALYPHGRNLSAKVRAFLDFIAEEFRNQPDFKIGLAKPLEDVYAGGFAGAAALR